MIRLGVVAAGPAVRIADGTQASAGDLILCTRNDHTVHAREPGRTLANGDLLRIEQVTAAGLLVRRALDAAAGFQSSGECTAGVSRAVS
jgi:hypothetical protein